jgi:FKBP-type peptidyl-prolyl cis-trans isomerase 2
VKISRLSALLGAIAPVIVYVSAPSAQNTVIGNGSTVSFEYTLSDDKGKVIESSKGKTPMTYTHGQGQIIPGLEKGMAGMKINDEKTIRVKPEEAYGTVDSKAFHEIAREKIPAEKLKVGDTLMATGPQGQNFPVRVHQIKDKTVVLDFNHPLAGKSLTFAVKVLDIKMAQAK